jgi:hypothetical protein
MKNGWYTSWCRNLKFRTSQCLTMSLEVTTSSFRTVRLMLKNNRTRQTFQMHRIICDTFIDAILYRCEINHINHHSLDNSIDNLETILVHINRNLPRCREHVTTAIEYRLFYTSLIITETSCNYSSRTYDRWFDFSSLEISLSGNIYTIGHVIYHDRRAYFESLYPSICLWNEIDNHLDLHYHTLISLCFDLPMSIDPHDHAYSYSMYSLPTIEKFPPSCWLLERRSNNRS